MNLYIRRIIWIFTFESFRYFSCIVIITFPSNSHWFFWFCVEIWAWRLWEDLKDSYIHADSLVLNHFLAIPQALIRILQMCVCSVCVCVCLTANRNHVPLRFMKTQHSLYPMVPHHISTEEVFIHVTFQIFSYCKHFMFRMESHSFAVIYQMKSTTVTVIVCCILQCLFVTLISPKRSNESTLTEVFVFLGHNFVQYFMSGMSSDIVFFNIQYFLTSFLHTDSLVFIL